MLSPFALIAPRPNIPAPRTPSRSPAASHVLLSPPSAHRNSTDSWNSSNHDLDAPSAVWRDDQLRLLARTLDALPAHLITPFNGAVPPSNLLDKIARGVLAAKGPNDWPHSIRATRMKLLELARRKAVIEEDCVPLGVVVCPPDAAARTPDSAEVLQLRTNTPIHLRRPVHRQSSMDFLDPDPSDRSECIARLSTRLQRHDRALHHPYLRPAHVRHRADNSPSTPGSSALNSGLHPVARKSTASASSSSFGSPMSISAPLRPSSLRRASTLTLASTAADPDAENVSKNAEFRRSGGYLDVVAVPVKRAPSYTGNASLSVPATPAGKPKKPVATVSPRRKPALNPTVVETKPLPRTPPNESHMLVSEKETPTQMDKHTKFRKGHKPHLSVSSDEEEQVRSKSAKKVRTHAPSWFNSLASAQPSLLLSSALPREKEGSESGRSSGVRSKKSTSSSSSTDNDLSTASTETAATTVSTSSVCASSAKPLSSRNIHVLAPPLTHSSAEVKKSARRNPVRNPSMFGHELPCPQRTPTSPTRIPVSSPIPLSPPANAAVASASSSATSPLPASSRPRTLRRAARRISFGSTATNANTSAEISRRHDGEAPSLGSAFQLA